MCYFSTIPAEPLIIYHIWSRKFALDSKFLFFTNFIHNFALFRIFAREKNWCLFDTRQHLASIYYFWIFYFFCTLFTHYPFLSPFFLIHEPLLPILDALLQASLPVVFHSTPVSATAKHVNIFPRCTIDFHGTLLDF